RDVAKRLDGGERDGRFVGRFEDAGGERRGVDGNAEGDVNFGSTAHMVEMVVRQQELGDAAGVVAVGGDVAENEVGVADGTTATRVDQGKLVAAVDQVEVGVGGRGEVETETATADEGDFGHKPHVNCSGLEAGAGERARRAT